jgi:hypothetical protein
LPVVVWKNYSDSYTGLYGVRIWSVITLQEHKIANHGNSPSCKLHSEKCPALNMKRCWCKIIEEVNEISKTFGACYSTETTSSYTFQNHTFLSFILNVKKNVIK